MVKQSTTNDYQKRMTRVVDHLHRHLDDPIRIDDLADVAHLSQYHWHRIYTAMQGETVAKTIKRLKLERAASNLANTETPIKDIASAAHYSSVEAFGRAFKDVYSQSPADYRNQGSHTEFKTAIELGDPDRFDVRIEPMDIENCASVSHTGPYMQINHAMAQLFGGLAEQNLLTNDTRMMAVFYDDPNLTEEEHLKSAACSPISKDITLAMPLEQINLHQGNYAKLLYTGPYADMKDAYQWLYGVWLPQSGLELSNAPALEEYLNNPQEVPPTELQTLMCLPLENND